MAIWQCPKCNYKFDEGEKGQKFDNLPENWICPECNATIDLFVILKEDIENDQSIEEQQDEEKFIDEELPESEIEGTLSIEESIEPEYLIEGEGYSEDEMIEKLLFIKELLERAIDRND